MEYRNIITLMKQQGISFDRGLTEQTIKDIEEIYDMTFPASLSAFYKEALPIGDRFIKWNDLSEDNISCIKEKMYLPYKWLSHDITFCEAFRNTMEAPKLIPIYSHRYMPCIDHPDPPVFSTVGADTIWYGKSLGDYLYNEFIRKDPIISDIPHVPLWSDIISANTFI